LVLLKESIEDVGFRKDNRLFLECVYGSGDKSVNGYLFALFDKCCDHPASNRSEEQEAERWRFLRELESEIAAYRKLVTLYTERDIETPQPMVDARLLPELEALDKILAYESRLERQFERKLQLLVAWRKAKGEALPAKLSLVDGHEERS
jgi:hypothetical protein